MKTAILLIPKVSETTDPQVYLSDCIRKVNAEGYILLHQDDWNKYRSLDLRSIIDKVLPVIDTFYLFVDFGTDDLMIDVIEKYSQEKEIVIDILPDIKNYLKTIEGILYQVSSLSDIPVETLKLKTRKREIVDARFIYFKRARLLTRDSFASIGALVGKDHADVMHGIKQVNTVPELIRKYDSYYNKPDPAKKVISEPIEPVKRQPIRNPFKSPYKDLMSCNNQGYSGYKAHSL